MKKTLSVLLALVLLAALAAGCANQPQPTGTQSPVNTQAPAPDTKEAPAPITTEAPSPITTEAPAPETTKAPAEAPEGIYIDMNGVQIVVGVPFADLEEALGPQTAPAETIYACDPDSDWQQTMHYYEGVIVCEDKDGVINNVQVSEGDAALMGKLRIGATPEEVKAVFGTPETEETWGMYYESTTPWVNFYLDDETGLVTGFSLMVME